jgi:hypothetical protein
MKKNETIIDLSGQDLSKSNLEGCNLSEANLKDSVISTNQVMEFDYITSDSKLNNEVGCMLFSVIGFRKCSDEIELVFTANSEVPKKALIGMIDKLRKQIVKAIKAEK